MIGTDQCDRFARNHPRSRDANTVSWIKCQGILQGQALDLGCGPARLDIRLCEEFPDLHIHGVDGSQAMIDIANHNVSIRGLKSRITLSQQDIKDIDGKFDIMISSDTLHHIHDPNAFWKKIKQVSKVGARVFVVDLLRPTDMDQVNRILKVLARTNDEIYVDDFKNSLCAAFSLDEIQSQLHAAGLDGFEVTPMGDVCQTVYIQGTMT